MKSKQKITQYIYLISHGNEYLKIGHATNLQKRLYGIQIGNPYKLELLNAIEVQYINGINDNPFTSIKELEKFIHRKFNKFWHRGEWYTHDKSIIDWFNEPIDIPNKYIYHKTDTMSENITAADVDIMFRENEN